MRRLILHYVVLLSFVSFGFTTAVLSQNYNYTLDLTDSGSYNHDCVGNTGVSQITSGSWTVKANSAGPAHCFIESNADFSNWPHRELITTFSFNRTGFLLPDDKVVLQVASDKSPFWMDVLKLDANFVNSLNQNISHHTAVISDTTFNDIASLKIRLMIYSTSRAPISVKNGGMNIGIPFLPLTLTDFKAKGEGTFANLDWQTEDETNVSHFEVERSKDGINWIAVKGIMAENESPANYAFRDELPLGGTFYYRLKMVDLDKSYTYSPVLPVHLERSADIKVFPNPANQFITISTKHLNTGNTVQIFNLYGSLMKEQTIQKEEEVFINLNGLTAGNYLIKVGKRTTQFAKIE